MPRLLCIYGDYADYAGYAGLVGCSENVEKERESRMRE
jgi:hypothetical protein